MDDNVNLTKQKIWTVSELNREVKGLFESCFPYGMWISGEVSNLVVHRSGHVYLTLKDTRCQVSATWFGGAEAARKMGLKNGMQVEGFGNLSVYEPRGTYQVNLRRMNAKGSGDLQRQFEELKLKLQMQGFFDPERKRPIPQMPKCVGVITSPTGAAIRDFLQIIERRFKGMHIRIFPATVQGPGTAQAVINGINFFNQTKSCDVIVVTRGGGSQEDLWGFNSEPLAHSIVQSEIPVISAIGHEIDFTIPDFVADLRVPTPSAAAELVTGHKAEIQHRIDSLKQRGLSAIRVKTLSMRQRLEVVKGNRVFQEPANLLRIYSQKLDEINLRSNRAIANFTEKQKASLNHFKVAINAFDPQRVVERGYSILTSSNGKLIRSIEDVNESDMLTAKVSDGEISLKVNKAIKNL